MWYRVGAHVRGNLVGYVAIFLALTGGAVAATAARNTVTSESIRNGEVKSADVQNNGLRGADIQESTLRGIRGPRGPAGPPGRSFTVKDSDGATIGSLLTADDDSLRVLTSTGYLASLDWQGNIPDNPIGILAVYSGSGCSGTQYIPAPTTGDGSPFAAGKLLRFREGGNYVAAVRSTASTVQADSYLSVLFGCMDFGSPTTTLAWAAKTLTPSKAGLPNSITGPLSISTR
jgi:hypothetical protein